MLSRRRYSVFSEDRILTLHSTLHMSAKCFTYWALYLNAAVSQFAIIIGKKQTTHHAFYYARKQMQKLSIDIEQRINNYHIMI